MNIDKKLEQLAESIKEAHRFIEKAEQWQDELLNDSTKQRRFCCYPSIKASAAKRASMDLTRSLANLRRREE